MVSIDFFIQGTKIIIANCKYYSKKWIEEAPGREPPHKDKEV